MVFCVILNNISVISFNDFGTALCDCSVVGLTPIYPISAYSYYSFQLMLADVVRCTRYNIIFANDLRKVNGFLLVILFLPPIILTATL